FLQLVCFFRILSGQIRSAGKAVMDRKHAKRVREVRVKFDGAFVELDRVHHSAVKALLIPQGESLKSLQLLSCGFTCFFSQLVKSLNRAQGLTQLRSKACGRSGQSP